MKQRNDIEKRVEEALNSLDGIQRATPQPWLFSRIKKRLAEEEDRSVWGALGGYLGKPAIAIAGLCFILMVNVFLVFNNQQKENTATFFSAQTDQPTDSESLIASGSSFDYETLLQP
ncbi:hypothetical protein [Terrimonas alba]|uniref:hypothetical protein n=1 Tax=Terrimonas alba TaxID=3349636 RepID=UPI0035F46622